MSNIADKMSEMKMRGLPDHPVFTMAREAFDPLFARKAAKLSGLQGVVQGGLRMNVDFEGTAMTVIIFRDEDLALKKGGFPPGCNQN